MALYLHGLYQSAIKYANITWYAAQFCLKLMTTSHHEGKETMFALPHVVA